MGEKVVETLISFSYSYQWALLPPLPQRLQEDLVPLVFLQNNGHFLNWLFLFHLVSIAYMPSHYRLNDVLEMSMLKIL